MKLFIPCEPRILIRKDSRVKKTTNYKRLLNLSEQMKHTVKVNLVHGIKTFKKSISPTKLHNAWKTGNYELVMEVIPWDELPKRLDKTVNTLGGAMAKAAGWTIESLPAPEDITQRFDTKNPYIKGYMNNMTGELVTNIKSDTQEIIQNAVERSFDQALSPKQVAGMIKDSIGLYPRLENAVTNYRSSLEKKGEMAPGKIDTLVSGYQDRLLDYRAMMIARTEIRMAVNYGQLTVWNAAIENGSIGEDSQKVWVVDGDPCEICLPMDGEAIGMDETWEVEYPDGSTEDVMIPTEAHPHCFCGMEILATEPDRDSNDDTEGTEDTEDLEPDEQEE